MRFEYAEMEDWARLYAWRNDPTTRANSRNVMPIMLHDHMTWLTDVIDADKTPTVHLYVATDGDDDPVGYVRLDENGDTGEISIALDAQYRGKGLGREMIRDFVIALENNADMSHITRLVAEVRMTNLPSLRAFADEEFVPTQSSLLQAVHENAIVELVREVNR